MSELLMECEEEELEPWQRPAPEVTLVEDDDDDDEPIFIGELGIYIYIFDPVQPLINQILFPAKMEWHAEHNCLVTNN